MNDPLSSIRDALGLSSDAGEQQCVETIVMWDKSIRTLTGIMFERNEVIDARDRYRRALERIRDAERLGWPDGPMFWIHLQEIARAALPEVKP